MKTKVHSKYLIVSPCGNNSTLFNSSWLKYKDDKNFDLCLLFYHENIVNSDLYKSVDFFYHLKGFKYHMIFNLLTNLHPEWLDIYDYFLLIDDDIDIDTLELNKLFELSRSFDTSISCASLSLDSFCSWPIFKNNPSCFLRYVGQIEVMAPLFNKETLKICLKTFLDNKSSWGLDSVWSFLLGYPKDKLIVFDCITMKHTKPVGKGELYTKLKINPEIEWESITRHYGAKKHNYIENGRLLNVSLNNMRLFYYNYKLIEFFNSQIRTIKDYDLTSRIKSRLNKKFRNNNTSV
jgi:hypothetical protein